MDSKQVFSGTRCLVDKRGIGSEDAPTTVVVLNDCTLDSSVDAFLRRIDLDRNAGQRLEGISQTKGVPIAVS